MGKPQPPAPPNPQQVAQAQTQSNQQTAEFQSQLNNGNSFSPYGSVTNVQDPGTNQWTQTTQLSPAEQNIFNLSTGAEGSALGVANDQIGRVGTALGTPLTTPNLQTSVGPTDFNQAVNNTVQSQFGAEMGLLQPQMQQASEQQNANLIAQGLNPNDAAWQNSMQLFNNAQGQERAQVANNAQQLGNAEQAQLFGEALNQGQFGNQAAQQGFQNQAYAQNTPINQFDALLSSGQVQAPSVSQIAQTGVSPTDVLGAYALQQQQENANYQAQMQQYNSGLGGLFNLGSAALMFA